MAFGRDWLESGAFKIRFKGAAYVGDEIETWGKVTKREQKGLQQRVVCSVGLRNRQTGAEIISGTATVSVKDADG